MAEKFCLGDYLSNVLDAEAQLPKDQEERFVAVCTMVEEEFNKEWNETDDDAKRRKLELEKKAIMGSEREVGFYKEKIKEILRNKHLSDCWFPPWYPNLHEGVFAELYGLAGLAPWAYDWQSKYINSTSAKLIGDRLYCLIDGESRLQPQRISSRRREQLKRTLLLATPYERLEYGFHEVYLHNGIRITIYSGDRTKRGQDVMVFRKYVVKNLSFEELVRLGTIPEESIEVFKLMIRIGFNVIFAGQVRSGKTTFLQTWQSYEDTRLEGLAIATDPETHWERIMGEAPVMQLIADGEELNRITKSLLRGDNDYILLEEMRDAEAFKLALDITSTGTKRSKGTIHDNDAINVPYKMATKICEKYGGSVRERIAEVYRNFDFVLEFCQDPVDRAKKYLKGIVQYSYSYEDDRVKGEYICRFNYDERSWQWNSRLDVDKLNGIYGFDDEIEQLKSVLADLERRNPIDGVRTVFPAYYRGEEAGA